MAISVGVLTKDKFLLQKIRLSLEGAAFVAHAASVEEADRYDLFLTDDVECDAKNARLIGGEGGISYPISITELLSLTEDASSSHGILRLGHKAAYLGERSISLTEVEFALLKQLYDANGEFVSREELLGAVWGGECESGVLNVYVHYLREKLEDGEKIIISSRKLGYKIDERYLRPDDRNGDKKC